jgi:hypothetical protein
MSTGKSVASELGNFEGKKPAPRAPVLFSTMRYRNHFDRIAARMLSQRGIAVVWELQVKAAAAFRRGNWLSAAGLARIADAAERSWRHRAGADIATSFRWGA